ncbi:MAG: inositol monophosphatase family protein [Gemmatimonadota bacterium]|jgi:myo-inositol-1(or 4)-monophosphatase
METRDLIDIAREAAQAAADVHRSRLGTVPPEAWSEKSTADFVTAVDHEAQDRILEVLHRRAPHHDIMAEESGAEQDRNGSDWLWIVDPLDGTTNYLHGYPAYAASVAVTRRGRLMAGAVIDSARDHVWTATHGGGAFLDGAPVHVSRIDRLSHALIGTGFPFKATHLLPRYLRQFDQVLRHTTGIRRAGAAALDLCHLAAGYFDGFWELWLAPWDIAAGTLIAREAGARVTTLGGDEDLLRDDGEATAVLAGNPAIHEALGALVSPI